MCIRDRGSTFFFVLPLAEGIVPMPSPDMPSPDMPLPGTPLPGAAFAEALSGEAPPASAPSGTSGSVPSGSAPSGSVARPDAPPEPAAGAPLRVLLADDNPLNRKVALAMLSRAGHAARAVADGAQAVAAVREEAFDVVLMDVQMPVMDGLEAARTIRALPLPQRGIPILALTADTLPETEAACRAAGMNGCLTKPFLFEDLRASLALLPRAPSLGTA